MPAYVELEPGRFREDVGLRYEDYVIGHVFEHRPGRTITATDNIWSSLLCLNQHPLHIDEVYASTTPFKKLLVSSLVTFGIVNGMTVRTISQQAVANLGWDKVRLSAPVFVGDTLYAETTILAKRPSGSRPGEGIVTVHTVGRNQDGVPVIEFDRTLMATMRGPARPDQPEH
ncbi:dehydratase [Streptomyces agglomeratus]|uniref:Dehydratase n=1 Tax=Streptomyces agglomeratus TaxID=285458 RepID=A0A1E5PIB6_9ACTN|nr:dehydratase [Streptomyces agglomeratus]OEJ42709.1 dehydratase [Streptomyces agglomeratus]OEJ48778.1 dehydratase [Streptomyces agglomeratus]OEJ56021.1 dehydratase [Streptomyces agglomeratus]OEJ63411.1 dehydratase [Streptomyces agglomeratus]